MHRKHLIRRMHRRVRNIITRDMDCPGIEMAEIQKEKDIHVRGVCPFLVYALCKIIERCKWGVIT